MMMMMMMMMTMVTVMTGEAAMPRTAGVTTLWSIPAANSGMIECQHGTSNYRTRFCLAEFFLPPASQAESKIKLAKKYILFYSEVDRRRGHKQFSTFSSHYFLILFQLLHIFLFKLMTYLNYNEKYACGASPAPITRTCLTAYLACALVPPA